MSHTVSFAIPVAPKCRIAYWGKAMDNLNRTLNSIENQSSESYKIYVVKFYDDRIRLDKDYRNLQVFDVSTLHEFSEDKDTKTKLALSIHDGRGEFFFRLDWDDLVHKDLVEYIEKHENECGWYIQQGYFYRPDIQSVIPMANYWAQCGSAFAINYSHDECRYAEIGEFHHQRILARRKGLGKPLKSLPFLAGMYTIHGDNISTSKHDRILKGATWTTIKSIVSDINEDFGLNQNE